MDNDVIILGNNYYSVLGAARSLGEAGYHSRLLVMQKAAKKIAGSSKYVRNCIKTTLDYTQIYQDLEQLRGTSDQILIIPIHDRTLRMLDEHEAELSEHYLFPRIFGGKTITHYMDKMVQKELAQQCGLLTAKGRICKTDDAGIEQTVNEIDFYPCFTKPLASFRCNAAKGIFAICRNEEELRKALMNAKHKGSDSILVEEFLDIEKELSVYGFAVDGKVYMPARMDMIRSGFGRHKGVAAEGIITSSETFGELKQKLIRFVEEMHFSGLFCIDLIQSNSKIYFSEMNLRCGANGYAVTKAGVNLYALYADMIYHKTSEKPTDIVKETHFLCEHIETDAFLDGFISYKEMKSNLSHEGVRFIEDREDPAPWHAAKRLAAKQYMTKRIKRILRP